MKNNLTNIFLLNMKHWNKLSPSPSLPLFFIHRPVHQSSLLYPTLSLPPFLSLPPSHQKKSHFFPHSSRVDKRPPSCLFFFQCLLTNKSGQKGTLQYFFPRVKKTATANVKNVGEEGKNNNEVSMHEKAGASFFPDFLFLK